MLHWWVHLIDVMDNQKVPSNISGALLQVGNWSPDKHPGYIMFDGLMVRLICTIDLFHHNKV